MDKSKDHRLFARGEALGQDLANAGKSMLTNKVPDSGTSQRLMYGAGALASGALNPAIPLGLLTGGAMYTQPAQKALTAMFAKRPELAAPFAEFVRNNSQYAIPAASFYSGGLLNQ